MCSNKLRDIYPVQLKWSTIWTKKKSHQNSGQMPLNEAPFQNEGTPKNMEDIIPNFTFDLLVGWLENFKKHSPNGWLKMVMNPMGSNPSKITWKTNTSMSLCRGPITPVKPIYFRPFIGAPSQNTAEIHPLPPSNTSSTAPSAATTDAPHVASVTLNSEVFNSLLGVRGIYLFTRVKLP